MKKYLIAIVALLFTHITMAQTNLIKDTGDVGIGTLHPTRKLEVSEVGPAYMQLTNQADVLGPVGAIKFNMKGAEVAGIEAERVETIARQTVLNFRKSWSGA